MSNAAITAAGIVQLASVVTPPTTVKKRKATPSTGSKSTSIRGTRKKRAPKVNSSASYRLSGKLKAPPPSPFVDKDKTLKGAYFSFELTGDLEDHNVEGAKDANEFLNDCFDMIVRTHPFKAKKDWLAHRLVRSRQILENGKKPALAHPLPPNNADEAEARLVIDSLADVRECDRFQAFTKTTAHATQFVLVFNLLNRNNQTFWCWRPAWMVAPLLKYVTEVKAPEDPFLDEAFRNMQIAHSPNPDNRDIAFTIPYTPPGQTKEILLPQYASYTFISIPHERLANITEEATFIRDTSVAFLEHLRLLLGKPSFRIVMHNDKEFFAKKIYDDKYGNNNLPGFLNNAITRVAPFVHGTDHVTTKVAGEIASTLYKHRVKGLKYLGPPPPVFERHELVVVDGEANI